MGPETATSLEVRRVIKARPDAVFRAWTEPDQLMRWSCPEGGSIEEAAVDLRIGGAYRLRMKDGTGKIHTAIGVYREIDPPHRLVYTWDWEEEGSRMGETIVTVQFNDRGAATEVVLTHEQFPAPEARDGHAQGWESLLTKLERVFE
jgi:uncharacterized protein YndB with AHSA1/START domain